MRSTRTPSLPAKEGVNWLIADIFAWIEDYLAGAYPACCSVGHRIIPWWSDFSKAVVITDRTLAALEDIVTPLAPFASRAV